MAHQRVLGDHEYSLGVVDRLDDLGSLRVDHGANDRGMLRLEAEAVVGG